MQQCENEVCKLSEVLPVVVLLSVSKGTFKFFVFFFGGDLFPVVSLSDQSVNKIGSLWIKQSDGSFVCH